MSNSRFPIDAPYPRPLLLKSGAFVLTGTAKGLISRNGAKPFVPEPCAQSTLGNRKTN